MEKQMYPTISHLGDSAMLISFSDNISEEANGRVMDLFNNLKQTNNKTIKDIVPAYSSLAIYYDITNGDEYTQMENVVLEILKEPGIAKKTGKKISIPVCYDISLAPDIQQLAKSKNLKLEEVIEIHTS